MIMPEFFFAGLFARLNPQACTMKSFAATNTKLMTGNFLRQHRIFFDRDTNLLYGAEEFKDFAGVSRFDCKESEIFRVRKPWHFLCYVCFTSNSYIKHDLNPLRKNAVYAMIWRHVDIYRTYNCPV